MNRTLQCERGVVYCEKETRDFFSSALDTTSVRDIVITPTIVTVRKKLLAAVGGSVAWT
jgi:hypothetical protein